MAPNTESIAALEKKVAAKRERLASVREQRISVEQESVEAVQRRNLLAEITTLDIEIAREESALRTQKKSNENLDSAILAGSVLPPAPNSGGASVLPDAGADSKSDDKTNTKKN